MADTKDNTSPPFTVKSGAEYAQTLIQKLTPVADKMRDLKTRLGARPYQVALITVRWSGGRRGVGTPEVAAMRPILPTPRVASLDSMTLLLQSVGLDESGTIRVSEISPSYTEDELRGVGPQGQSVPSDTEFFWEITYPRPAPAFAVKRRYQLRSAPMYNSTAFHWVVVLNKATEERDRIAGIPGGSTG